MVKMDWSSKEPESGRAVRVTVAGRPALIDDLDARIAGQRGFALATLNLDHVVKLRRSRDFHAAYVAQTHVTADGNPIVWLERIAGRTVDLVPGSELVEPVAGLCARHGVPIALVGATEAALAGATEVLQRRHPGLQVALCHAPPMGFDPAGAQADDAIAAIGSSGASVCFVALGAPKQEIFAARAHAALPHVGFLSIGAGLDFLAGTQRRAPTLVRRLAAEWLWRLASNPGRLWARYAACLAALPGLTLAALKARGRRDVGQGAG